MANVWPTASSFPQEPLMRGNNESAPATTLRTEMAAGPPKVRQRFTAGYYTNSYSFIMTDTNVDDLMTFYNTTCSGGAESFEWSHPRTGSTEDWRFIAPPYWRSLANGLFEVTIELEQLP